MSRENPVVTKLRKTIENLEDFRHENKEFMETLEVLGREYNEALEELEAAARKAGVAGKLGPAMVYFQGGSFVDIPTVLLKCSSLLLEPGVVTGVDKEKLLDAAIHACLEKPAKAAVKEKEPALRVKMGNFKSLVFTWPGRI